MWNKTERSGKLDVATGKAKQAVAAVTGNKRLKAEGQVDQAVGKAKVAVGSTQRKVGNAIEAAGKAVQRQPLTTKRGASARAGK
jgi:uncharacterized protein YjbJ (UPF0337 family)